MSKNGYIIGSVIWTVLYIKGIFMKKKLSLILISCLIIALICGALCACDPVDDSDTESVRRANAVLEIERAFLNGMNESWDVGLKDDEIATLSNAGDYVMTSGWLGVVVDTINASNMQTAKLEALANTLKSDSAKALMKDFDSNATNLISLIRQTDLTASDVSSLVNSLLIALVNDSGYALDRMMSKLVEVKMIATNINVVNNLNDAIATTNLASSVLKFDSADKEQMLIAFDDAKNAIGEIVEFAYTMSMDTISEELFDIILSENGALGDISNSELQTLVGTLMTNVTSLKDALSASEIESLNIALDMMIEKFDTDTIVSPVYSEIVKFAKYAYTLVDVIPTLCDIVVAGGDCLGNVDFLQDLKVVLENDTLDEDTRATNATIIIARIMRSVMNDFTSETLKALIDSIGADSIDEYQKAVPIMTASIIFNLSNLKETVEGGVWNIIHKDLINEDILGKEMALVFFLNGGVDNLKRGYQDYLDGKIDAYALGDIGRACSFSNFGVTNPYSVVLNTKEWYDYYMTTGIITINKEIGNIMPNIIADLKAFVDDYYSTSTNIKSATDTIANWDIHTTNILNDEYAIISDTLLKARLGGMYTLLTSYFAG